MHLIISISFSNGALKLAKRNVLVKRLSAIENLGNIEILCTDKTGTITENKLILEEIFSQNEEKCLTFAYLASEFVKKKGIIKNSFDLAIYEKIKEKEIKGELLAEIPFSSHRLMNSILVEKDNHKFLIVRGAPEKILEITKNNFDKDQILKICQEKGKEGKRILAVAFKEFFKDNYKDEDEKNLEFLGLLFFTDPLKKDARETIKLAEGLGIQVKILTGDSKEVATQIAKEIGIIKNENQVILGKDLENLSEKEFEEVCKKYQVFARVLPETKLKIIKSLQKKYDVGFIGEGINDVPALKISNVAISVKGAAEISKEVSDIILLKDDLRVIVEGIKLGRSIFYNVQKYIKATLASNFGNMYSVAGISLISKVLPMLPTQILLLNLLSDLPLVGVSTDNLDSEELKKPKLQKFSQIVSYIFLLALISSLFDFIFFGLFYPKGEKYIQTYWFLLSILTETMIILSIRTRRFFISAKPPSKILIFLSISVIFISFFLPFTQLGQNYFQFIKLEINLILIIIILSLLYIISNELVKYFYFKYSK